MFGDPHPAGILCSVCEAADHHHHQQQCWEGVLAFPGTGLSLDQLLSHWWWERAQNETCFVNVGKSSWGKESAVHILPGSEQGFGDSSTSLAVAEALICIYPCAQRPVFDLISR